MCKWSYALVWMIILHCRLGKCVLYKETKRICVSVCVCVYWVGLGVSICICICKKNVIYKQKLKNEKKSPANGNGSYRDTPLGTSLFSQWLPHFPLDLCFWFLFAFYHVFRFLLWDLRESLNSYFFCFLFSSLLLVRSSLIPSSSRSFFLIIV